MKIWAVMRNLGHFLNGIMKDFMFAQEDVKIHDGFFSK